MHVFAERTRVDAAAAAAWQGLAHILLVASRMPASREPRAASREPRAASREPRAASREPRAANREPQAASRKP